MREFQGPPGKPRGLPGAWTARAAEDFAREWGGNFRHKPGSSIVCDSPHFPGMKIAFRKAVSEAPESSPLSKHHVEVSTNLTRTGNPLRHVAANKPDLDIITYAPRGGNAFAAPRAGQLPPALAIDAALAAAFEQLRKHAPRA